MNIQSRTRRWQQHALAVLLFIGLGVIAAPLQALQVSGAFTGWWAQPDQQNHGLIVSISRLPSGERIGVIYWAVYDEGEPTWLLASGSISGDRIEADLFEFDGITFMQPNDAGANFGEAVGTFEVQFSDCQNGTATYALDEPADSGEFTIQRITNQPGVSCSGGISDNFGPRDRPQTATVTLDRGAGAPEGASGEMILDLRPGRGEFEVRVFNLNEGRYALFVGDESRGEFEVASATSGTEGHIRFRSPRLPGGDLLDFDPRGEIVEVRGGNDAVMLHATAPEQGGFMGGNGEPPFDFPDNGSTTLEIEFENLGVVEGSAWVLMEAGGGPGSGPGSMSLEFEIRNGVAGEYTVLRRGQRIGVISIPDGETSGALEFGFPPLAGQQPFDFDPSGAMFEIVAEAIAGVAEGTVLFQVDFPTQAPGTGMGGGPGMGGGGGGPGSGGGGGPGSGGGPGFGDNPNLSGQAAIVLDSVRVDVTGTAEAFYRTTPVREIFSVRTNDVAAGEYTLQVDGIPVGTFAVGTNGFGRIDFKNPVTWPDDLPLDFTVLGATLSISGPGEAGEAFSGTMPE